MAEKLKEYLILAFTIGFAFEFGGQLAWVFMDIAKIILRMPIG